MQQEKWETKKADSWSPQPLPLRLAILYLIHLGPMEDTTQQKLPKFFTQMLKNTGLDSL